MFKRFITSLFCLFLILFSIPFIGDTSFLCSSVYADSDLPSGYTPANTDMDLASSFNDYVKSRNANFNGSLPDATNIYILNLMNKGAQNLDTNLDTIKSKIAKKSETGGKVIWYFDSTVTNFYNRLFEFLLQDLDLSVGDTADKELYNGLTFTDDDGNMCLVYVITAIGSNSETNNSDYPDNLVLQKGTYLKYDSADLVNLFNAGNTTAVIKANNRKYTFNLRNTNNCYSFTAVNQTTFYANGSDYSSTKLNMYARGYPIAYIIKSANSDPLPNVVRIGYYTKGRFTNTNNVVRYMGSIGTPDNTSVPIDNTANVTVNFVTVNNQTINNNNYEGDTYITNEGDVINNNPSPGGQDPGWDVGGGQGSYDDGQGNNYTINFPDFELPDLNIDWSIQGLGNKFPFSIPFDIASLVSVLNAEPEAPRFEGTVNFGFTTWDYDINLEQFDSVAHACRIAELLLLVFGLILITRSIIKG